MEHFRCGVGLYSQMEQHQAEADQPLAELHAHLPDSNLHISHMLVSTEEIMQSLLYKPALSNIMYRFGPTLKR